VKGLGKYLLKRVIILIPLIIGISIIIFGITNAIKGGLHPTQKPVKLLEYLVKTYTNEGETVLDFCAGSMSTAIACINTDRRYIMIEKDDAYFQAGKERIENLRRE